jgi:hypothetical protein
VRLDRAAKLTPSNSSVSIAIRWSRRPAPRWAIARSTTLDVETFRGNGRTCRTCHSKKNGTFSPEDARERLAEDPTDSLFVHDGLDGGLEGTFPSLGFANLLKIPTLWSVARTGRIATTNSAKTLEDVAEHYALLQIRHSRFRLHRAGSGRHGRVPEAAPLIDCSCDNRR